MSKSVEELQEAFRQAYENWNHADQKRLAAFVDVKDALFANHEFNGKVVSNQLYPSGVLIDECVAHYSTSGEVKITGFHGYRLNRNGKMGKRRVYVSNDGYSRLLSDFSKSAS